VSRTNISILLATALLGILLWVVISIARDASRAPEIPLPMPSDEVTPTFDPSLPRISNRLELTDWLSAHSEASGQLIDGYQDWLRGQGYPADSALLSATEATAAESLANEDDSMLLLLAGQGDITATHLLAERSLETDPLAALDWFDQAVIDGSVYAMIRIADLLTTFADPGLADFVSDPAWQAALESINSVSPAPRERALAWSIAAVTVAGYAILDPSHAERIANLSEQLDSAGIERACNAAQDFVLQTAAARRVRGGAVFSTESPPFAISVANPEYVVSCDVPVIPLVSLTACEKNSFVGAGEKLMTAWLCPQPN
jgi:hypothetical protein